LVLQLKELNFYLATVIPAIIILFISSTWAGARRAR